LAIFAAIRRALSRVLAVIFEVLRKTLALQQR